MRVFLIVFKILFIFTLIQSGIFQALVPSGRQCVTQGLFEIIDGTCKNYYLCVYNGVVYTSYDMTCKGSTLFNPTNKLCTADYTCTQITTTTTPATIVDPCPLGVGRFPMIPSDSKCQKYYYCFVENGQFVRYNFTCPNSLQFNSKTQKCMLPCPSSSLETSLSCTNCKVS